MILLSMAVLIQQLINRRLSKNAVFRQFHIPKKQVV